MINHIRSEVRIFFVRNQETVMNFLFALSCVILYGIFPEKNKFQEFISNATFFLIIPILYIKIILKKNLKQFGWQIGDWKKGLIWAALSLVVLFLVLYVALAYTEFPKKYDSIEFLSQSYWLYLTYEIILIPLVFFYEFFFRGFVMFGSSGRMREWAIVFQALFFLLFFFIGGNFSWNNFYFIILPIFSGIIAYKSRSILFSFATSIIFISLANAYLISLFLKATR